MAYIKKPGGARGASRLVIKGIALINFYVPRISRAKGSRPTRNARDGLLKSYLRRPVSNFGRFHKFSAGGKFKFAYFILSLMSRLCGMCVWRLGLLKRPVSLTRVDVCVGALYLWRWWWDSRSLWGRTNSSPTFVGEYFAVARAQIRFGPDSQLREPANIQIYCLQERHNKHCCPGTWVKI